MQRANTALVRTERRLSVSVRVYLPPHNFTVRPRVLGGGIVARKSCSGTNYVGSGAGERENRS
ncbi:MAG: hypothetical protein HC769_21085 [Cyanobacteria bacterium CRU_2_1]|nr:hypothetical protein [Cyanobacteria bacterium RU_5_0]NJR61100.1 hypothetical protein [Cyanobacteria bacterium CRU_2_1]